MVPDSALITFGKLPVGSYDRKMELVKYCEIEDCEGEVVARGWCRKHYSRWYDGRPLEGRTRFTPNTIRIEGDVAEIDLYNKQKKAVATTLIDSEDVELIQPFKWGRMGNPERRHWGPYVVRHGRGGEQKTIYLHRFLMEPIPDGKWVDHVSGDTLDNRKSNLRICDPEENVWNQRQQTGIFALKTKGRFRAQISREFESYEEALEQRIAWEEARL